MLEKATKEVEIDLRSTAFATYHFSGGCVSEDLAYSPVANVSRKGPTGYIGL